MADTDTKDPTDQVGSYEDDLAKRSTRDQQQDGEANGPTPEKPKNEAEGADRKSKIRKGISAVRDPLKAARDKAKDLDPREKIRNLRKQMSPSQFAKKGAEKILKEGAKKAAVTAASNPVGLIIIIVVIFILVMIIVIITGGSAGAIQNKELKIVKSGPDSAINGAELDYQINVAFAGTATDIIIKDSLPAGTIFVSSGEKTTCDNGACNQASRTVSWSLKEIVPLQGGILSNVSTTLSLKLKSTADDSTLVNQAQGEVIGAGTLPINGGGPISGDIAKLLPNPLPADPDGVQDPKNTALGAITPNKAVYEAASKATGVPWQIFAGIHYREGGAAPNTSLVSGRPIGDNEPDVVAGPGCSNSAPRGVDDGIPEPMAGGCGFSSMLDSGIYAGNLLKQKVSGDINAFDVLVQALSRYNGGGNSNCGKGVPYSGCPRLFEGEDDPYALNFFDTKHKPMYVIYCADYTKCDPPREDGRPGTATVAKWAAQDVK